MADALDRTRAALSDSYMIDREVGRGGMATVYLAQDLKHQRQVAIKVLHPDIAASLGRERFLREIGIVANLRHRGILPLYDSGEADGLLYYVMPYVEGPTLRDRLDREKQLPVEEALRITSELAAALDEAHSHGVIHRDVKPENVLFEGDQPLIADFGVATALEEAGGEKLTRTGVAVGTPSYMSPEQAAGGQADARSDEYALACVLYEMLGGTPPFTGPTPQAVMARHALDPVPDLATVRSTVPEGVIAAVEKAMSKVPADRYPTAGAFAQALERGDEKRRRAAGRRRRGLAVGALLAAAVLTVAYVVMDREGNEPPALRLAVLPFDASGVDLPDTLWAKLLYSEVIDRMVGSGAHLISAVAADRYGDLDDPVASLREDLDVDVVWLTDWDRDGPSARAHSELLDARSMTSLASTTIGVAPERLADAVPRLVQWAADALGLSPVEPTYEPDPEARKLVVKARAAWFREHYDEILELLDEATLIDPDYAEAYALYSLVLLQHTHEVPPGERTCDWYDAIVPRAVAAARRALELDSTLVLPHTTLGHALWEHELDVEAGRREFEIALEMDPDDPDANMFYGWFLLVNGRPTEALQHLDRAAEAYDFWPRFQLYKALAYSYGSADDEEAEAYLRMVANRFGNTFHLRRYLLQHGRVEEAIQLLAKAGRDTTAEALDARFDVALARGNMEAVDRLIARDIAEGNLGPAAGRSYVAGYRDQALDLLEQWWEMRRSCRSRGQMWLLVNYTDLTTEPRVQAMMDEVGIPWRESEVWAEMSGS
jgi:serine/threonine-protein kinase